MRENHDNFKNVETGYLYSLWNGKIREYRGEVLHKDKNTYYGSSVVNPEVTYFMVHDEQGIVLKKMCCSVVEGEVYNKVVWLTEPNKSKAAEILIQYEELQISKLKLKIKNHEDLIETLRKEMES